MYTYRGQKVVMMGMNVATLKYVALAALFVTTFVFTLLPLKIVSSLRNTLDPDKRIRYSRAVSFLNCFAGGVFLATAFLDLIPEVTHLIHQALPNVVFPLAEFIILVGFFLILMAEQIAINHKELTSDSLTPPERLEARSIEMDRDTLKRNSTSQEESTLIRAMQEQDLDHHSNFHSILLFCSLSLHSVFEGLAIGFQLDFNVLLQVLTAVLVHKVPVAFSMGLNLVQGDMNLKSVVHLNLWFSLMSPIGLIVALTIEELEKNIKIITMISGVLQGLATGTFTFIVFMEILPKELKQGRDRLLKLLSVLIGFSFVCFAILWETKHPQLR